MNNLVILELPSNLGLKAPYPGKEPGVRALPDFLRKNNFHALLNPAKTIRLEPPEYSMELDAESQIRNADKIAQYAEKQAKLLGSTIRNQEFPLVLGGDCSILVGNALALKETGKYALFFLDGHTDFMLPSMSQTHGAAGMDLALVAGYGPMKLTNIHNRKPYFEEGNIWCVGNRDYEDWYVELIRKSDIQYIDLAELRQMGTDKCITGFLQMVQEKGLDGFWIHLDVDVLSDDIMPAVDSRQPDGLHYVEFNTLMKLLLSSSKAVGMEITILDPDLDPTTKYTKDFVVNFCSVFNSIRNQI